VRLVLCDDHRLFIEPIAALLERRGHKVVVTTTPVEAIQAVGQHDPDLCAVDLKFPDDDGLDLLRELRRRYPECPVTVLSSSTELRTIAAAAAAGAAGYLRKDQPVTAIFDGLERIAGGRSLVPAPPPRPAEGHDKQARVRKLVDRLTEREREVLAHLVDAQDTIGIARSLGVAPSTARTHLQNVLLKLGVHNRLQAVALVTGAGMDGEL
jgi:two-component system nitrate/nitrite response regulator NarL